MSKLLIGLSAVQAAVLVFLAFRVVDLDARLDGVDGSVAAPVAENERASSPHPLKASRSPSADAAEIRRIVREEVASLKSMAAGALNAAPAPAAPGDPALRNDLARDLDRYIARGGISAKEMADFQTKMALLPPAERSEMLRAMTKAMNDGRLEGQF